MIIIIYMYICTFQLPNFWIKPVQQSLARKYSNAKVKPLFAKKPFLKDDKSDCDRDDDDGDDDADADDDDANGCKKLLMMRSK